MFHTIFKKLTTIEQRICKLIGIHEDCIIAFSQPDRQNSAASFKRDVIHLKVPSTGNTPERNKLASQVNEFQAFADLNTDLI